ncbi:velvet factor-domain-containing protein [Entophlyctis helioformis]|nr:velvet factor-domain-containing protein [Entophlyctis helioformis]
MPRTASPRQSPSLTWLLCLAPDLLTRLRLCIGFAHRAHRWIGVARFWHDFGTKCRPNYELIIRQQPSRARMSGFGIKDRRPLDPTPIAQVIMRNPDGSYGRARYDDAAFLISHVTLWSTDMSTQLSAVSAPAPTSFGPPIIGRSPAPDVPPTSQHNQILLGALISPCHILSDVDGDRGLFFIFPDVSVRTSGTYRIKISLYDIKGAISKKSPISFVVSDAFTVYSPKTFPGMSDSTPLSRTFSKQGIRIHIRTDAPKRDDQDSP